MLGLFFTLREQIHWIEFKLSMWCCFFNTNYQEVWEYKIGNSKDFWVKIGMFDDMKCKKFCAAKDTVNQMRRQMGGNSSNTLQKIAVPQAKNFLTDCQGEGKLWKTTSRKGNVNGQ